MEISEEDLNEMHVLISRIDTAVYKIADDTRNLNNLIHVVKGDGVRNQRYARKPR